MEWCWEPRWNGGGGKNLEMGENNNNKENEFGLDLRYQYPILTAYICLPVGQDCDVFRNKEKI
jgi:hypothetical protein